MENVISLDDLFPKRLFHRYQRGYSWEHQQAKEDLDFRTELHRHRSSPCPYRKPPDLYSC